jgi:bifunctional non-homologous end joining protein LigD
LTPVTWDEVETAHDRADAAALRFTPAQVLERVAARGDLMAPLLEPGPALPKLGGSEPEG